jgi:hypothetical protein
MYRATRPTGNCSPAFADLEVDFFAPAAFLPPALPPLLREEREEVKNRGDIRLEGNGLAVIRENPFVLKKK